MTLKSLVATLTVGVALALSPLAAEAITPTQPVGHAPVKHTLPIHPIKKHTAPIRKHATTRVHRKHHRKHKGVAAAHVTRKALAGHKIFHAPKVAAATTTHRHAV